MVLSKGRNPKIVPMLFGGLACFFLIALFGIILRSCQSNEVKCASETIVEDERIAIHDDDDNTGGLYIDSTDYYSWRDEHSDTEWFENGRYPTFPPDFGGRVPIDSSDIILEPYPDLPVIRPIVGNRLNLYCQDNVDLLDFAGELLSEYEDIDILDWRDRYKKIQLEVPSEDLFVYKEEIKARYEDKLRFVIEEILVSHSNPHSSLSSSLCYTDCNNDNPFWHQDYLNYQEVARLFPSDSSVTVAVIDGSFQPEHPDITSFIYLPWNANEYTDELEPIGCHGTHVAGLTVGTASLLTGAKLMPLQISDDQGLMGLSYLLDAIFYAITEKADVINLSIGTSYEAGTVPPDTTWFIEETEMWDEIFQIAKDSGCIVVQAAGNSAIDANLDPMKRKKHSIIVGAHDRDGRPTDFTNFGESVDIYAPGFCISSSVPFNDTLSMSGTSMASPIVAAAIALKCQYNRDITFDEVHQALLNSSKSEHGIRQLDLLQFLHSTSLPF